MPVQLFTEAERARRNRFPETITYEELVTFFTLSERDLDSIPGLSSNGTETWDRPCYSSNSSGSWRGHKAPCATDSVRANE
jgi:hypothetical protein